jgi:hypothetical protein
VRTWARPALLALVASACSQSPSAPPDPEPLAFARRFPTAAKPGARFDGCLLASPLAYDDHGTTRVIVADGGGTVAAIDPETGASTWSLALPAPPDERAFVVATPAIVGDRLVVAYHTRSASLGPHVDVNAARLRQRVAVIDLAARAVDPGLSVVELSAALPAFGGGTVTFDPTHALARGTVRAAMPVGAKLGRAYVTFGNVRDVQPWHGWIFEIDLDAWQSGGAAAAVTAVRVTTPEADCGTEGSDGSRQQRCGGGLWSPAGPLVVPRSSGGYDLVIAPGNGQLDLGRGDLANTLVRLGPGLTLDTGCDPKACAGFDSAAPSEACITSCSDVFVPRLLPGEPPVRPESGKCDGVDTYACWSSLDYLDGSVPARAVLPSGRAVLVYTTKDGHAWLVDADHLGTLHDRAPLVAYCGTKSDPCAMDWAGMIVTQPALTQVDGDVVAVVPTFMPDQTHPAGIFAIRVVDAPAGPRFAPHWAFPAQDGPEAIARFRRHPSRARIATPRADAGEHAFVVEAAKPGEHGALLALRMRDGALSAEAELAGPGYRFIEPLVIGSTVFVTSCDSDSGEGRLEAYDLR